MDGAPDPAQDTDSLDVARRAQGGDEDALNELFRRYQEPLRRIVRIRMGSHLRRQGGLESMDMVQRTFAKAHAKLSTMELRSSRSVLNWLARIAERQIHDANDYMSAEKRDWRRTSPLQGQAPGNNDSNVGFQPEAHNTLPEAGAVRTELQSAIDEAMEELGDEHREVILLRDYSGTDWETIASELGRDNVHSAQELHRRARIKLARALSTRLGDYA
ncbi:MAG: RNA polymerase sigma-70 factor (ECF subfamily) [Planctomycetota bacterium]|jgi:RNA polymerase sigma-70 factor (ECF subfamily)